MTSLRSITKPDGSTQDMTDAYCLAAAVEAQVIITKTFAGHKIVGAYPTYTQSNMLAEATKYTNTVAKGGTLTTGQNSRSDYLDDCWGWIEAVRANSAVIEASVMAIAADGAKTELQKVQDILDIDVSANSGWPGEPPTEA